MMKHRDTGLLLLALLAGIPLSVGQGHAEAGGTVVRFDSAAERPGIVEGFEVKPTPVPAPDGEMRGRTTIRILVPVNGNTPTPPSQAMAVKNSQALSINHVLPFWWGPVANTPSSLACIYNLAPQPAMQPPGCNPNYTSVNSDGGSGSIALVLWNDDPTAVSDNNTFSDLFGLPRADLTVVYAGGSSPFITGAKPPTATADDLLEESLDTQWSHAMAPHAKLFLVEAQSNSWSDVSVAIQAAQYLVSHNGGGEISMSFAFDEVSLETTLDGVFSGVPAHVTQVAGSGDAASVVVYPSASASVVSVGGSSLNRDSLGNFVTEGTWDETGAGVSAYELRPSFQNSVQSVVGSFRGTPDISMLGDPATGVYVYGNGTWYVVGGTSLSSPLAAGVLNVAATNAGSFPNQAAAISTLYTNGSSGHDSRDILSGACGTHSSQTGYDLCTGWGTLINPLDNNLVTSGSGQPVATSPFYIKCSGEENCTSPSTLMNASQSTVTPSPSAPAAAPAVQPASIGLSGAIGP